MQWFALVVFCVAAAVVSVNGDVDDDIESILESTNNMLIKYDRDLDKAVPFKELRASLKALDVMAKDYQGASRNDIYSATNMGYQATDNYYRATDTLFTWCVKADRIISYMLENSPSRKRAFNSLYKLTGKGVTAIKESLEILEGVRSQLTEMSNKLRPVPSALTKELGQLREEHLKRVADLKKLKWGLFAALAVIGVVATIVLGFAMGPIGVAIGIAGTLAVAGIPLAVIQGKKEPDEEERWKITEAFYKSLIEAVNHAQGNVTAVKDSLDTEITHVQSLRGDVEGSLDIMDDFGDFPVKELNKLSETLHAFIDRHGGGSFKSRRRREVIRSVYHGLDVDRVSYAVDSYMNATAKEREADFWTIPVNPSHFMADISKFSF